MTKNMEKNRRNIKTHRMIILNNYKIIISKAFLIFQGVELTQCKINGTYRQ